MSRVVSTIFEASIWTAITVFCVSTVAAEETPVAGQKRCEDSKKCQFKATLSGKVGAADVESVIVELDLSKGCQIGVPLLSKIPYLNRLFKNTGDVYDHVEIEIPRNRIDFIVEKSARGDEKRADGIEEACEELLLLPAGEPEGLVLEIEDGVQYLPARPKFSVRPASAEPQVLLIEKRGKKCCAGACADACVAKSKAVRTLPRPDVVSAPQKSVAAICPLLTAAKGLACGSSKACSSKACCPEACSSKACSSKACCPEACSSKACCSEACSSTIYGTAAKHRSKTSCAPCCEAKVCESKGCCPFIESRNKSARLVAACPHPFAVVSPPPAHPMMGQLIHLATENAALKVEQEAQKQLAQVREEYLRELFQAQRGQAELQARLEASQQRQEVMESVMELVAENAKLETVAELTQEHVEMLVRMAQLEAQAAKSISPEKPSQAFVAALEKAQTENARLRELIHSLEKRVVELVAERATPDFQKLK